MMVGSAPTSRWTWQVCCSPLLLMLCKRERVWPWSLLHMFSLKHVHRAVPQRCPWERTNSKPRFCSILPCARSQEVWHAAGQMRFGPDVEWLEHGDPAQIDYNVSPSRASTFAHNIRKYWPELPNEALQAAYSGVRAKVSGPGQASADFVIQDADVHSIPGLINLFGIESPGLTSSLALAEHVRSMIDSKHLQGS
jgi:glycine/D-amino acid oxidase-like deaminating enzyme